MKPKRLSLFPNLRHRKNTFLFSPGQQILDQIETICSQQDKFGNYTKTFWFRIQNDIGTFVLSFLTCFFMLCIVKHCTGIVLLYQVWVWQFWNGWQSCTFLCIRLLYNKGGKKRTDPLLRSLHESWIVLWFLFISKCNSLVVLLCNSFFWGGGMLQCKAAQLPTFAGDLSPDLFSDVSPSLIQLLDMQRMYESKGMTVQK